MDIIIFIDKSATCEHKILNTSRSYIIINQKLD